MRAHGKDYLGCHVVSDGGADIGRVKDLYFDARTLAVRYLVVDTGGWLDRNEVLLVPSSFASFVPEDGRLAARLTAQQIEASPPVTADMPVSREYETSLHEYYGWPIYWGAPELIPAGAGFAAAMPVASEPSHANPHLRALKETRGYHVAASDGEIGHVEDVLIDVAAGIPRVTHVVVETRNWLPGAHVVVDVSTLREISYEDARVVVALTKDEIKHAPSVREVEGRGESVARV